MVEARFIFERIVVLQVVSDPAHTPALVRYIAKMINSGILQGSEDIEVQFYEIVST